MTSPLMPYGLVDTRVIAKLGGDSKSPQRLATSLSAELLTKVGFGSDKRSRPERHVVRRHARN